MEVEAPSEQQNAKPDAAAPASEPGSPQTDPVITCGRFSVARAMTPGTTRNVIQAGLRFVFSA